MPVDGDLYVLSKSDDEGWVSPRPVYAVVAELITEATDLSDADLEDLDAYVDRDDLSAHLDGDPTESLTFPVEGHEVAIAPDGSVQVDPA